MSAVLGFDFYEGPEVPAPLPIDFTMGPVAVDDRRKAWAALLEDQIRCHDAWGVLVLKPNLDVVLFDVHEDPYKATGWGGTAFLLLAREVPPNYVYTCDAGGCDRETAAVVLTEDGWLSMCRLHAAEALGATERAYAVARALSGAPPCGLCGESHPHRHEADYESGPYA